MSCNITAKTAEGIQTQTNTCFVIWFTGLPCSGKTTLLNKLYDMYKNTFKIETIDGDEFRKNVTSNLGFSNLDRNMNIETAFNVVRFLVNKEYIVLAGFVSPLKEIRDRFKREMDGRFKEVYVKCSAEECARRDVKGMWEKAKNGEIKNFTGFDAEYQEPENPDLIIDTEKETIEESVNKLKTLFKSNINFYVI